MEFNRRDFLKIVLLAGEGLALVGCSEKTLKTLAEIAATSTRPPGTLKPLSTIKPSETIQPTDTITSTSTAQPTETPKPTATETPRNPANDMARSLGYENCPDCTLVRDPGVNTDGLLTSRTEGVLGYYDYYQERWTSTKGWKEAIIRSIGDNWDSYMIPIDPRYGYGYIFTLVTDGELITQPFEVKTRDGELLATARVSIRGFYVDKAGKLQSVIFPQLVELPNEKLYLIMRLSYRDWNDTELEEQIRSSPKMFNGGNRGLKTFPILWPDVKEGIKWEFERYQIASLPEAYNYYLILVEGFNQSWGQKLMEFYRNGIPPGEIIFPKNISFGDMNLVDLPNN